jgi:hypothetical protein
MVTLSSESKNGSIDFQDVGKSALGTEPYELWDPSRLRRLISLYEAEVEGLNQRLAECQQQVDQLQQWRADVENSRAWRLLGVYRAVVHRVGLRRPTSAGR